MLIRAIRYDPIRKGYEREKEGEEGTEREREREGELLLASGAFKPFLRTLGSLFIGILRVTKGPTRK